MKIEKLWKEVLINLAEAMLAFGTSLFQVMGCYPLVPAFYGVYCLNRKKKYMLYGGLILGMFYNMSFQPMLKYFSVICVIGIGIRLYCRINQNCSGMVAGMISGAVVVAMNCSTGMLFGINGEDVVLGIGEGLIVFGFTTLFHYLIELLGQADFFRKRCNQIIPCSVSVGIGEEKAKAFSIAVDELTNAFKAMNIRSDKEPDSKIKLLENEITGHLCACCEDCTICWNRNKYSLGENIRRLISDALAHTNKEEIFARKHVEQCSKYRSMVDEVVEAVGRVEVNEAWNRRLKENRIIVAQQLDAMSDFLHAWNDKCRLVDDENLLKISKLIFEAKEKGIIAEKVHIYEDASGRISIHATVYGKWNGGIPIKNFLLAAEKAMGICLRLPKNSRSIITKSEEAIWLYEDVVYYTVPGIATKKKSDSPVSGDSFVLFELDNGSYNVCLSDGMGSGNDARRESETVVELMQKFMEAGFKKETAIRLMNSAMVLQGREEAYSTLDYGEIDLYSGNLQMVKVGAASSFIKRGELVEVIQSDSLPAGFDINQELCSAKVPLNEGDFLVMITDGVLEYLHVEDANKELARLIGKIKTDNAGILAERILDQVLKLTDGYAIDDMTVLTIEIWEK